MRDRCALQGQAAEKLPFIWCSRLYLELARAVAARNDSPYTARNQGGLFCQ